MPNLGDLGQYSSTWTGDRLEASGAVGMGSMLLRGKGTYCLSGASHDYCLEPVPVGNLISKAPLEKK